MRCCVTCRLVKTVDQFYDTGCENCHFLSMDGDRERIYDCTTTEFQVGRVTGRKQFDAARDGGCFWPPPAAHRPALPLRRDWQLS